MFHIFDTMKLTYEGGPVIDGWMPDNQNEHPKREENREHCIAQVAHKWTHHSKFNPPPGFAPRY